MSTDNLLDLLENTDQTSFTEESKRLEAIAAAQKFLAKVQKPGERFCDWATFTPIVNALIEVFDDVQVFKKWQNSGTGEVSAGELAKMVGIDAVLLGRMLRFLASSHVIEEIGEDIFRQTETSRALIDPLNSAWARWHNNNVTLNCRVLPDWLKKHDYANPHDPTDGPFQLARGVPESAFEYLTKHPDEYTTFNRIMASWTLENPSFGQMYPLKRLVEGDLKEGPIFVDIGGNVGVHTEEVRCALPEHASRLVLQDLPDVVKTAKVGEGVQVMPNDFFKGQPVKHAKNYYLSHILHDWNDDDNLKILKHTRDAMLPGYSKLLINEIVIFSKGATTGMMVMDFILMTDLSAGERTEQAWRNLLDNAGFKIVKIWNQCGQIASVIEAEVA